MKLAPHILAIAAMAATAGGCASARLSGNSTWEVVPGQKFSGSIKTIPGGGHFVLAHGEREFDVVLTDFRAPRAGEPGDEKFIEALGRIIYPPIFCTAERVTSDAIHAVCLLENRAPLGDMLRKWGAPERLD